MRAPIERLAGVAGLVAWLAAARAFAALPEPYAPPETEPTPTLVRAADAQPFLGPRLEVQAGVGAPLGTVGAALVFQPHPALAFGVGAGAATGQPRGPYLQVGGFVRANILRRQRFTLGPVLTFSGGNHARDITYQRPQYASADSFMYTWKPGYRLDVGVGAEMAADRFAFRVEAGLGLYLNDPQCWYQSFMVSFVGACDGPEIPEAYHFTFEPGRLAPYVSLAVGLNAGRRRSEAAAAAIEAAEPPGEAPQPRVDSAWLAPTALTVPAGSVTVALYEAVLARVTVGLADRFQLWAGTSWTDLMGAPLWEVGAKLWAVRAGRFNLALLAEHLGIRAAWNGLMLTGGGAVASVCLDPACASVVSVSAAGGWLHEDHDESPPETKTDALVSPSAVIDLRGVMKVVVEGHLPASAPRDGFWAALVRLPIGRLTLDLGVAGVFQELSILPAGTVAFRW